MANASTPENEVSDRVPKQSQHMQAAMTLLGIVECDAEPASEEPPHKRAADTDAELNDLPAGAAAPSQKRQKMSPAPAGSLPPPWPYPPPPGAMMQMQPRIQSHEEDHEAQPMYPPPHPYYHPHYPPPEYYPYPPHYMPPYPPPRNGSHPPLHPAYMPYYHPRGPPPPGWHPYPPPPPGWHPYPPPPGSSQPGAPSAPRSSANPTSKAPKTSSPSAAYRSPLSDAIAAAISGPPTAPAITSKVQPNKSTQQPKSAQQKTTSKAPAKQTSADAGVPQESVVLALGVQQPWQITQTLSCHAPDVFPYTMGKGWFAFNQQGKTVCLLERLYRVLCYPSLRLINHPEKRLGEVVRWMSKTRAARKGVPPDVMAFEILDQQLFEDEIYPQSKSGSFRKTARHWSICSPRTSPTAPRRLSFDCMFVPRLLDMNDSEGKMPMDPNYIFGSTFRAPSPQWTEREVESHITTQIRPLEAQVRAVAIWKNAMENTEDGAQPRKRSEVSKENNGLRWHPMYKKPPHPYTPVNPVPPPASDEKSLAAAAT